MILQIKVKVKVDTLQEFASKIMTGALDRSAILGETYCEKDNPSVGISYWEVENMEEFETKMAGWKPYYESIEVKEVVKAQKAMFMLIAGR
jgi:hypothetical protein